MTFTGIIIHQNCSVRVPLSVYSGSWQPSCCYNTVKSQPNKDLPTNKNKKQVNVALE
ncbi:MULTISPECIES: hypothetical protein [Lysinibacillus]|uniref:hypothetical protein n=1 Tax=Lysinibacillus TaxID=400634 RepID=UPI0025810D3A|nr:MULTISPECIES: hypothetical protein [Lysinibacillus]